MKTRFLNLTRFAALAVVCLLTSSCDNMRVYGSVGYSSYGGYGGYGYGTSVSIGGRIR